MPSSGFSFWYGVTNVSSMSNSRDEQEGVQSKLLI